jgi:hypothetical protein
VDDVPEAPTTTGNGIEDQEWTWLRHPVRRNSNSIHSVAKLGSEASEETVAEASLANNDASEWSDGAETGITSAKHTVDPQSGILRNSLHHIQNVYEQAPDVEMAALVLSILIKMLVPDWVSALDPFKGEKLLRKQMNMVKDLLMLYTQTITRSKKGGSPLR